MVRNQEVASRRCTRCLETRPASAFSERPDRACGLASACKECASRIAREARAKRKALKPAEPPRAPFDRVQYARQWRKNNPDKCRAYAKRGVKADPEWNRARSKDKYQRLKKNPAWRVSRCVKASLWKGLKGQKGIGRWFDLLGYEPDELCAHLERQFTKGMSLDNYGKWHIDHIVPLSSFAITGPDDPELRRAWALSNLRPLWAKDNLRKGARMESIL